MSLALYRKYRPQAFAEIIGQTHVVQTLTNALLSNSISHAYLFSGPRGSGKTTIARVLAKALNCENRKENQFEPCNKCSSCLEIAAGNAMDIIEVDAASHRGVDDIRELRDGARFSPVKSKHKVFIIDECHQLSKDANNALLKTLEEPPSHAVFILATTEIHKMIPTLVSRCQRFDFRRLQTSDIIKKLEYISEKEGIKFDKSALSLIALNARGSFRDAESLLDECLSFSGKTTLIKTEDIQELLGVVEISHISKFVDFLLAKDAKSAVLFLNKMVDDGIDLQEFTKTLVYYLRQALLTKINPDFLNPEISGFSTEEIAKMKNQTSNLKEKDIQNMLELFIEAENKMKYASIPQLPLELAVVDITNI
ncbi:DNA polymerase III subunit gamma/tau [Patescibacteria group bacterium]|nr:DNA polymerase III subunit gamma/tau [Patescibacteria group bacterium]MBU4274457.1 DNA polymerase III subunit gamma/tau [Patescibacteria group bacterium]MBU4367944.1 DNA polymerase III subunit gamma/tau [Patescibacteria group bacterium]MBU4462282.1 DNA polymerase III subunit gamma/tau [Patescibacteria group bacterium]MCG2699554.1 DNA polymerase III subunit gamma/tau [Candidatus Parcubacteria bacterium]